MKLRRTTLLAVGLAILAGYVHLGKLRAWDRAKAARQAQSSSRVPAEMRRSGDCTYLTIAEWNLVFGPQEYADFMADRPPSRFPYLGQIQQFWNAYGTVFQRVKADYPYNGQYHVMDTVIGVSATAELSLKCAYERTIGRVAEASRSHGLTAEDHLAAKVARDYVNFVKVDPWYLFDFVTPLKQVWQESGYNGPDPLRKWERKYFLTSEYAAKIVYAWIIKKGTQGAFGTQKPITAVVVDHLSAAVLQEYPEIQQLQRFEDGSELVTLPRYQAFQDHALGLAKHGVHFIEIAGNKGMIMVSVVAPTNYSAPHISLLLAQDLLTQSGQRRLVLEIPIAQLSQTLNELQSAGLSLEHIYDF